MMKDWAEQKDMFNPLHDGVNMDMFLSLACVE